MLTIHNTKFALIPWYIAFAPTTLKNILRVKNMLMCVWPSCFKYATLKSWEWAWGWGYNLTWIYVLPLQGVVYILSAIISCFVPDVLQDVKNKMLYEKLVVYDFDQRWDNYVRLGFGGLLSQELKHWSKVLNKPVVISYVIGSEKRDHVTQMHCCFSNCHGLKP